jgi:hypothetical protein
MDANDYFVFTGTALHHHSPWPWLELWGKAVRL